MNKKKSTKKAKSNKNEDLKVELQEAKDKYLRLYSEFENYRRRTSKEKIEMIDSLNELLAHESCEESTREDFVDSWRDEGQIHELIDGSIDIYNYTLRLWSVENYEYIEMAFNELGCEFDDWHSTIQRGQYIYYSEIMEEAIEQWIAEGEEGDDK